MTTIALVPSVVHQIVNYPGLIPTDLSSIENVGIGGAHLPPELAMKFSKLVPRLAIISLG